MSIRQMYGGSIVKPGLNTLASPAAIVTYQGLWTWGRNNNGQLGLGNITNYSSPKQVGVLTTWLSTACGRYYTTAIKTDGTLWTWGYNAQGQLGLGNRTYYSSPKQVGVLTTWLSTACGGNHTTAMPATTTYPYTQYAGIWNINSQGNAKAAGTWP